MVATMSLNYGSTSKSAETSITNELNLSFGLDSVSTAVSDLQQANGLLLLLHVQYDPLRWGNRAPSHDLNTAFAMVTHLLRAMRSTPSAHEAMPRRAPNLRRTWERGQPLLWPASTLLVAGLSGATNPDLSFLQTFPHAVAGVSRGESVTTPIPLNQASNEVLLRIRRSWRITWSW